MRSKPTPKNFLNNSKATLKSPEMTDFVTKGLYLTRVSTFQECPFLVPIFIYSRRFFILEGILGRDPGSSQGSYDSLRSGGSGDPWGPQGRWSPGSEGHQAPQCSWAFGSHWSKSSSYLISKGLRSTKSSYNSIYLRPKLKKNILRGIIWNPPHPHPLFLIITTNLLNCHETFHSFEQSWAC